MQHVQQFAYGICKRQTLCCPCRTPSWQMVWGGTELQASFNQQGQLLSQTKYLALQGPERTCSCYKLD